MAIVRPNMSEQVYKIISHCVPEMGKRIKKVKKLQFLYKKIFKKAKKREKKDGAILKVGGILRLNFSNF